MNLFIYTTATLKSLPDLDPAKHEQFALCFTLTSVGLFVVNKAEQSLANWNLVGTGNSILPNDGR